MLVSVFDLLCDFSLVVVMMLCDMTLAFHDSVIQGNFTDLYIVCIHDWQQLRLFDFSIFRTELARSFHEFFENCLHGNGLNVADESWFWADVVVSFDEKVRTEAFCLNGLWYPVDVESIVDFIGLLVVAGDIVRPVDPIIQRSLEECMVISAVQRGVMLFYLPIFLVEEFRILKLKLYDLIKLSKNCTFCHILLLKLHPNELNVSTIRIHRLHYLLSAALALLQITFKMGWSLLWSTWSQLHGDTSSIWRAFAPVSANQILFLS